MGVASVIHFMAGSRQEKASSRARKCKQHHWSCWRVLPCIAKFWTHGFKNGTFHQCPGGSMATVQARIAPASLHLEGCDLGICITQQPSAHNCLYTSCQLCFGSGALCLLHWSSSSTWVWQMRTRVGGVSLARKAPGRSWVTWWDAGWGLSRPENYKGHKWSNHCK